MNRSSLERASLSSQEYHFWLPKQAATDFYLRETTKLESKCQIQHKNYVLRKHARCCPQGAKIQKALFHFHYFNNPFQVCIKDLEMGCALWSANNFLIANAWSGSAELQVVMLSKNRILRISCDAPLVSVVENVCFFFLTVSQMWCWTVKRFCEKRPSNPKDTCYLTRLLIVRYR